MQIKRKSLAVAVISGVIISTVLILTLIAYVFYIELKNSESRTKYFQLLQKINAKIYSKYIESIKLEARIERNGPLKGKPVIEGSIKNKGKRTIAGLLVKVVFLDKEGAVLYETLFHPEEPPLGSSNLTGVSIPYFRTAGSGIVAPGASLAYKRIIRNCPKELLIMMQSGELFTKDLNDKFVRLNLELIAIEFQ